MKKRYLVLAALLIAALAAAGWLFLRPAARTPLAVGLALRAALGGVVWAVCPVPNAAPHGLVVADDTARPPQGRRLGAGAI